MFIVCLSGRAGKFKRKAKGCLLFVYPAGWEVQKKGKKLFIVCLSGRAGKFKKKGLRLLIACLSSRAGSLKETQKVVYCLFIQQGGKIKRGQKLLIVC